jgi:hypothetical protein
VRSASSSALALAATVLFALAGCTGSTTPATPSTASPGTAPARRLAATAGESIPARVGTKSPTPTTCLVTTLPWTLPQPLSRETVLAVGDGLLLAGGLDRANRSSALVRHIDPLTGRSAKVGMLSDPVHDAGGALVGGHAYIVGGGAQFSVAAVQQLGGSGTARVVGQLPRPRSDLVVASSGEAMLIIGGYDGTVSQPQVLRSTDGRTFTAIDSLPIPVRYPAVAVTGSVVWVFGGQVAGHPSTAIQRIDVASGRVTLAGRLAVPVSDAAAFSLDGQVLIVGGATTSGTTGDIWRFDPATLQVDRCGRLPGPVQDAGSGVWRGSGYLLGGEDTTTQDRVLRVRLLGGRP